MSPGAVLAQETMRPQTLEEFGNHYREVNYRLRKAKVAYADYESLRQDFILLRNWSDSQIDAWIIKNFAYMDEKQLELVGIRFVGRGQPHPMNLPPEIQNLDYYQMGEFFDFKDIKKSLRSYDYKRADVMEGVDTKGKVLGIVDRKGTGLGRFKLGHLASNDDNYKKYIEAFKARNFKFMNEIFDADHSDGLASGGEVVAEVTRETAVRLATEIENEKYQSAKSTVKSYFIIDTGLDILRSEGKRIPAAIYGRQAHWRNADNFYHGSESKLRVGQAPSKPSSSIVTDESGFLQRSITDSLVDFGGVIVRAKEVAHNFAVPSDGYIYDKNREKLKPNPQKSNAWIWGHSTYEYYINSGDPQAIRHHVQEMMGPLVEEQKLLRQGQRYPKMFSPRLLALELRQTTSPELMSHLGTLSESGTDPVFINFLVPRLSRSQIEEFLRNSSPEAKARFKFLNFNENDLRGNDYDGTRLPSITPEQFVRMALLQLQDPAENLRKMAIEALNNVVRRPILASDKKIYRHMLAILLKEAKSNSTGVSSYLQGLEQELRTKFIEFNTEAGRKEIMKALSFVQKRSGSALRCERIFSTAGF